MKPIKIQFIGACLYALILLFTTFHARSQCFPTSANNLASFSNNTAIGTYGWSNVIAAKLPDFNYANVGATLGLFADIQSNYLVAKNPGFNIPSYATICGIQVSIEESASGITIGTVIKDNSVKIVKNNLITGTEHASGTPWTGAGGYNTYGSPTDLWGASWLPSDVNSNKFGVAISVDISFGLVALLLTANIDDIQITVYYDSSAILSSSSVKLSAMKAPGRVNMQWMDVTPSSTRYFTLEKSIDSHTWTTIDSIPAAATTASTYPYTAADPYPNAQNYYRLRQTDVNDVQRWSDVVPVEYTAATPDALNIFPNPSHGLSRISPANKTLSVKNIIITDLYGRPLPVRCTPVEGAAFEVNTGGLPPGIYIVQAVTSGEIISSRLMVR